MGCPSITIFNMREPSGVQNSQCSVRNPLVIQGFDLPGLLEIDEMEDCQTPRTTGRLSGDLSTNVSYYKCVSISILS